jgi:hypothetical protein
MDRRQQEIRKEKLQYWTPIVEQCDKEWQEYETKQDWCRKHDVSISHYYYWRSVIRYTKAMQGLELSGSEADVTKEDFVDVTGIINSSSPSADKDPADHSSQLPAVQNAEAMIEVNSCRIYLYPGIRRETLAMLAEVLHVR